MYCKAAATDSTRCSNLMIVTAKSLKINSFLCVKYNGVTAQSVVKNPRHDFVLPHADRKNAERLAKTVG
jgi:hypothetical protein